MAAYRLAEYGRTGRQELPNVYPDVATAVAMAEHIFRGLALMPWRRPWRIDVYDLATGRTVTRLDPDDERDDDVCPACGAPTDPFDGAA